jgi:hypothetical protein
MASSPNPMLQMALASRMAQAQGGGAPGMPGAGGPGGPGGAPDIGDQASQQGAELAGADPGLILKQLTQINSLLGVLFIQTFQRLPNVASHVSGTMKALSKAIKETQQATSTQQAVQPRSPIQMSAAAPPTENQAPPTGGGGF